MKRRTRWRNGTVSDYHAYSRARTGLPLLGAAGGQKEAVRFQGSASGSEVGVKTVAGPGMATTFCLEVVH